jgi:branched-chain amino acid transport system permease protein
VNDIAIYVLINGSMYYLVTAGLSLSYGIQGILDIGNAGYIILASYFFFMLRRAGIEPLPALPIVFVILFLIGLIIHMLLISPLRGRGHMDVSLSLFGVLLVMETLFVVFWGANPQRVKLGFLGGKIHLFGRSILGERLMAPIMALCVFTCLTLVMKLAPIGRVIQGAYSNPEAAELSGISLRLVANLVYASSAALTAFAALVCATVYGFQPSSVIPWFLIGFTVVVLGGRNSAWGSLLGAMIVAVAEAVTARYLSFNWVSLVSAVVIIVVLIVRPTGILGERREASFAQDGAH